MYRYAKEAAEALLTHHEGENPEGSPLGAPLRALASKIAMTRWEAFEKIREYRELGMSPSESETHDLFRALHGGDNPDEEDLAQAGYDSVWDYLTRESI